MRLVLQDRLLHGERISWKIRVKASGEVIDAIPVQAAAMIEAGTGELVGDRGQIIRNARLQVWAIENAPNSK